MADEARISGRDQRRAERARNAMLAMVKLDLRALERAADGVWHLALLATFTEAADTGATEGRR